MNGELDLMLFCQEANRESLLESVIVFVGLLAELEFFRAH